ncbi:MAG TPA: hypothetical protein VJP78_00535 [Thermoleophilia bacterium]|nr:hypothetical protein [Thermoleophilia bacterium]
MARCLRNGLVSFNARTLAHFGGVYLVHVFFARLGLRKALTKPPLHMIVSALVTGPSFDIPASLTEPAR